MRIRRMILVLTFALICILITTLCMAEERDGESALTLSQSEMLIPKGKSLKLSASYDMTTYGKGLKMTWETSDSQIASVMNGSVKGVEVGETKIICRTAFPDGTVAEAVCRVIVYQPVISLTVNPVSMIVPVGSTVNVQVNLRPANASFRKLIWTSTNHEVATVDEEGKVTGVAAGRTTVTATLAEPGVDKQKAVRINITVTQNVNSIQMPENLTIDKGKTGRITAELIPSDATNKKLIWSTSDPKVAVVSNGVVKALATGTCMVTAEAADEAGASASCQVTVIQKVTGLKPSAKNIQVQEKDSLRIQVVIQPADASDPTLIYQSDNPQVAIVDENGSVTGVGIGTCNIMFTTADGSGITGQCVVTVKKPFELMYGLSFGDDKNAVSRKIADGGGSASWESGALHGNASLFSLKNPSYDYLFTDGGRLNCVRNLTLLDGATISETAEDYWIVFQELTEYFGSPNGRGPTARRISMTEEFVKLTATFMDGPFYKILHHDEWYVNISPNPLKIDLIYAQMGNKQTGDHGIAIELDIEAQGV